MTETQTLDAIQNEIGALLDAFESAKRQVEDEVRQEVDDFLEDLENLEEALTVLDSEVAILWQTVSQAKDNLTKSASRLRNELSSIDLEERLQARIEGGGATIALPMTAIQINRTQQLLQGIPDSLPSIPSGRLLEREFQTKIQPQLEALKDDATRRMENATTKAKDGVKSVKKMGSQELSKLEENLKGCIAEVGTEISVTIDYGEEVCGTLEGGVGSLFQKGEDVVSSLDDAWKGLEGVWEGLNDDLPEAKGTVGDVQTAIENTKYVIDEVVQMI